MTEKVNDLIARIVLKHPGQSNAAMLKYFEEVHQELAPLARELETVLAESRANEVAAMKWLTEARFASGDKGKRMLPEFIEYLKEMKEQRDRLLAICEELQESAEYWSEYFVPLGIVERLDAAIASVKGGAA